MKINSILYFMAPTVMKAVLSLFVVTPILTRYFSVEEFGIYTLIMSLASTIIVFSANGTSLIITQNYKLAIREGNTLIPSLIFFDWILRSILLLSYFLFIRHLLPIFLGNLDINIFEYLPYALFSLSLTGTWESISQYLVISKNAKIYCVIEVFSFLVYLSAITIPPLIGHVHFIYFFTANILMNASLMFISILVTYRKFNWKIDIETIKTKCSHGLYSIPPNVLEIAASNLDKLIISKFINLQTLGIYHHAKGYCSIFNLVAKSFLRTQKPSLLASYEDTNRQKDSYILFIKIYFDLTLLAGIAAVFFSYDIIDLISNGKFSPGAKYVVILYLYTFIVSLGGPYVDRTMYLGKIKRFTTTQSFINIFSLFLTVPMVYFFQIYGAIISFLISAALRSYVPAIQLNRENDKNDIFGLFKYGYIIASIYLITCVPVFLILKGQSIPFKIILFLPILFGFTYKFIRNYNIFKTLPVL